MRGSKLIELYKALDVSGRISLRKWVNSPFHNQREDVSLLYNFVYRLKDLEEGIPEREWVFGELFPGKPYNDEEMRHLMSYLHKVMEDFLVFGELSRDKAGLRLYLLQAYDRLNLNKHFMGTLKRIRQMQERSPIRDNEFHYRNYKLLQSEYNSFEGRADAIRPETLQGISEELDLYYVSSKLRNACNILTHEKLYKVDYKDDFLNEIIGQLEKKELTRIPAVGVYYSCYKILKDENAEFHFTNLVQQITESGGRFSMEETRGLYLLAINYGIAQMNLGRNEYIRKVFELYKKSLAEKVLLVDGFLSPYTYTNIAATAIKLSEFSWVENFIREYRDELSEFYRMSFYDYNLAKLCFAKKEFSKVTHILNNMQIRDIFMQLESKATQIKAYYELGEFKLIEYQIDNFRQVLRRREVLTYHKTIFSHFVIFMKRLINLPPADEKAKQKLRNEIQSAELTIDKDWFLAKVNAA